MGGRDASQTRYIFTKLTKEARTIFDPRDDDILTYLDDDGRSIEPEYYMPTLPMILVNGSEGIGTGFSCYVPPFNPDDIKTNILNYTRGQGLTKMTPWFRGFKGTIQEQDDDSWVTRGVWTTIGKTIKVSELPPGRWTQDYKEHLDTLVEKKTIGSFTNNSTTENVDFVIQDYSGKDLVKDLKLEKTIRCSNMHLFHPTKGICKYESAEDILKDFINLRVEYYVKRKARLLEITKRKAELCSRRAQFVKRVIDGDIVVFKRKKQDLEEELSAMFPKVDDSFDYLLHTKTVDYTEERVAALFKEWEDLNEEVKKLQATGYLDMWKMDIKKL